jgi:hypothetical protein
VQQRDQRFGIRCLPGAHVPREEVGVDVLVGGHPALFDRRARALKHALGGGHARFEHGRRLVGREPDDIPQQKHRSLRGSQQMQRGNEGERDTLLQLDLRCRIPGSPTEAVTSFADPLAVIVDDLAHPERGARTP